MKRIMFFVFISVLFAMVGGMAFADDETPLGFSLSASLVDFDGSFGFGASLQSPLLFGTAGLRIEGYLVYYEGIVPPEPETTWTPFMIARAGLCGYSQLVGGFARFYGAGGVVFAFLPDSMSGSDFAWGGYGLFGFEFFLGKAGASGLSYYIELGSNGIPLIADALASSPMLVNGFSTCVGLRYFF